MNHYFKQHSHTHKKAKYDNTIVVIQNLSHNDRSDLD
jgi:hypothetical protein